MSNHDTISNFNYSLGSKIIQGKQWICTNEMAYEQTEKKRNLADNVGIQTISSNSVWQRY